MTEAWTTTLEPGDGWRFLGSSPEQAAVECVLRALDAPVLFATGTNRDQPDGEPITVPAGDGGRLDGHHFFAKAAGPGGRRRILIRGVL